MPIMSSAYLRVGRSLMHDFPNLIDFRISFRLQPRLRPQNIFRLAAVTWEKAGFPLQYTHSSQTGDAALNQAARVLGLRSSGFYERYRYAIKSEVNL
jgi:hypothetical protein